jgi:nicotinate-nucleotide pyrophosphorylase (carboxylating)
VKGHGVNLTASEIRAAVKAAVAEDIGGGDVTTHATVPKMLVFKTVMRAREPLVVAGLDFAKKAFLQLSSSVKIEFLVHDGMHVGRGENLLRISGSARAILSAERVALNFVQRLSGVATDFAICRGRQRHARANPRYAQDHARLAAV